MIAPELKEPGRLWYLATVYTSHPGGLESAFRMAARATARLFEQGVTAYSPIAHGHPLSVHGGLDPSDHALWMAYDRLMMARTDGLVVHTSEGWAGSKGIGIERKFFREHGKPIFYLDPADL